jgi:hypothetical protein
MIRVPLSKGIYLMIRDTFIKIWEAIKRISQDKLLKMHIKCIFSNNPANNRTYITRMGKGTNARSSIHS